jgi:hypothetical protein
MGGYESNVTKTLLLGTARWLATPSDGRNIAKIPEKLNMTSSTKTQIGNPGFDGSAGHMLHFGLKHTS